MQETVTKDELKAMRRKQVRIVTLADMKKVKSIKVQAHDLKNEEGKVYEIHPDHGSSAVCIIRKK